MIRNSRGAMALPAMAASALLAALGAGVLLAGMSTPAPRLSNVDGLAAQTGDDVLWSGAVFIRGEEIRPPFNITISDASVLVNGVALRRSAAESEEGESLDAAPESGAEREVAEARDALLAEFRASWSAWCEALPIDAARAAALGFFAQSPLVERVEPDDGELNDLVIGFAGAATATHVHLHPVDAASEPEPDAAAVSAWRQAERRRFAERLCDHLARGGVAIIQDEGHCIWPAAEDGAAIVAALRGIAREVADSEARYAAVRELIPDDEAARDVAGRLGMGE
ncbi:MAG: hypothetical protein CHACPFDD_01818 [Phycisphaerae bacterium]|nr:hypothetical protein [Phycisphaerae bacterium]